MTAGSTNAANPSSPSPPKYARPKDTAAAARSTLTRTSSNCSRTSRQRGVGSSLASSLGPWTARALDAAAVVRPFATDVLRCLAVAATVDAQGAKAGGMVSE